MPIHVFMTDRQRNVTSPILPEEIKMASLHPPSYQDFETQYHTLKRIDMLHIKKTSWRQGHRVFAADVYWTHQDKLAARGPEYRLEYTFSKFSLLYDVLLEEASHSHESCKYCARRFLVLNDGNIQPSRLESILQNKTSTHEKLTIFINQAIQLTTNNEFPTLKECQGCLHAMTILAAFVERHSEDVELGII